MHHFTAHASLIRDLFYYAQSKGIEKDRLARLAGIPLDALENPESEISLEQHNAAWEHAAALTHDPLIGLHLAEMYEPSSMGIVGYLLFNSKNVGEALEKLSRYHDLISERVQVRFRFNANEMGLTFAPDSYYARRFPFTARQTIESASVFAVKLLRSLTREPIAPRTVHFASPAPLNPHEYERIFGAPVLFRQKENMIVYDGKYGASPIVSSNPTLLALFEHHAKAMMERAQKRGQYSEKLRLLMVKHIQNPKLSIEFAAQEFAMTPRTLQRKLKQEGTSYQTLFDEVRKDLAISYLREMNCSVWEAALLVGFSEASAFVKSFKRWTGVYPKEFKERADTR